MPKLALKEHERMAQPPLSRHFDLPAAYGGFSAQGMPSIQPQIDITTTMVQPDAKEDSTLDLPPIEGDCGLTEVMACALTDGSTYTGQWLRGLPDGNGLKVWPDGKRYQGEFQGGNANGTGTCILDDGSKYVGPWVDNHPHGSMGFKSVANGEFYVGEFAVGKEHGEGTLTLPDCSTFVGQFNSGLRSGKGHAVFRRYIKTTTCDIASALQTSVLLGSYEGGFENDRFQGEGTYKWNDGRRYEGQWHVNKMHGHGKYTFADGRTYEGQYKNGAKSGMGTYSWPDGRRYVGQILQGTQHGQGVYINAKGKRREGVWHHGIPVSRTNTAADTQ